MVRPWDRLSGFHEKSWQHKKKKHNPDSKSHEMERKRQKKSQEENRQQEIILQKMPGFSSYEEAVEALRAFFTNPDVQQLDGKKDIGGRIPTWFERDIVQEKCIRKSRGPGGQNVNKNATTVRISLPLLKLVHEAQSERTQEANRKKARAWLADKVYELFQLWQSYAR